MNGSTIQAAALGHIAALVLERTAACRTAGAASRGIYLQPPGDLTLYLSSEPFRGPLTINLVGGSGRLPFPPAGDLVLVEEKGLLFEDSQAAIALQRAQVWEPPAPPAPARAPQGPSSRVIHQAASLRPDHPYSSLLDFADSSRRTAHQGIAGVESRLPGLTAWVAEGCPPGQLAGMTDLLGAGPGLTPLGDDLLIGFALASARSNQDWLRGGSGTKLSRDLLQEAQRKTTTLSWSLLYCALQGSGDERVIRVLDGLIAGREIPDPDLADLLDWGNSSGMGVLAGALLALS